MQNKSLDEIKVAAVALGCAKNRIDTEEILGLLGRQRLIIAASPADADIIIVNTCSFIESAQQESVNAILKAAASRKGRQALIIAAGCLAEQYGGELLERIPELAGVIGVHSYHEIVSLLQRCLAGERESLLLPPRERYQSLGPRLLTASKHSVYVKIADGCDNRCCYCLIPSLRGSYRSRPPAEIIEEVKALAASGVQEINLVAQDTTAFGLDLPGAPDLAGLLQQLLQAAPQLPWLRVLYAYPSRVSDQLIELIANEPRLCKYLDLPLQHVHNFVLARMGRHYSAEDIRLLIERLRRTIPGMALRTTLITGYPGESRQHFESLLLFLNRHPLERVGAFVYSPQEGTAAASLECIVPRRVGEKRRRALMSVQKNISLRLNYGLIGRRVPVLVERSVDSAKCERVYYARTEYQAPEVDGGVYFKAPAGIISGNWVSVRITAASSYDLLGVNPRMIQSPTI